MTRRADLLARLARPHHYDLAIVGGGATGLGVALDAAARGLSVVLRLMRSLARHGGHVALGSRLAPGLARGTSCAPADPIQHA